MERLLLTVGIISLVACALSLLVSALNWFGYYRVLDGASTLYIRLRRRMTVFFTIGIILAAIGIASLIVRAII